MRRAVNCRGGGRGERGGELPRFFIFERRPPPRCSPSVPISPPIVALVSLRWRVFTAGRRRFRRPRPRQPVGLRVTMPPPRSRPALPTAVSAPARLHPPSSKDASGDDPLAGGRGHDRGGEGDEDNYHDAVGRAEASEARHNRYPCRAAGRLARAVFPTGASHYHPGACHRDPAVRGRRSRGLVGSRQCRDDTGYRMSDSEHYEDGTGRSTSILYRVSIGSFDTVSM
jgi:hypothetical protein